MTVGEQSMYLASWKDWANRKPEKAYLLVWEIWDEVMVEQKSWRTFQRYAAKVQFLITIIHEPKLLIFDEPFSGFDPSMPVCSKTRSLLRKTKGTVIFSTHNMASVEELCDHIALINNAKVVLDGPVRNIKKTFKTNTFEYRLTTTRELWKGSCLLPLIF